MAVPFILVFFLVSPSVLAHRRSCPKSFNCGNLGPLQFPFYNITDNGCGLVPLNCSNKETPKIQVEKWSWEVQEVSNNSIKVRNDIARNFISQKNCDLFSLFIPINTSSISVTRFPNVTLAKCFHSSNPKVNQTTKDHFHIYSSYEKCPGYTIYYSSDPNHYLPISSNLPPLCQKVAVPAVPSMQKKEDGDLFSLFAFEYYIGFNVSNECKKCHLNGGQCSSNGFHEFHCIIKGEVIPIVLILLLALFLGSGKRWSYISSHVFSRNFSSDLSKSDLEGGNIYFGVPVFSYKELDEATNNFNPSKELGDGGFGTVYQGKLRDGREVAVKRLFEHNFKRVTQFMNEIEILTRLRHRNLVSLYGCTSPRSQSLLLVYEYIPNGTVADHLHGCHAKEGCLTWPVRMNIAIETAAALAYLHSSDIIHRDVKTTNILLDDNFCVKVADFGLSRDPGYVDPEYHQCYQLTDKSDVYSLGVVLIELISSMPAVDIRRHKHEINLANLAMNRIQNRAFNELIDPWLGFGSDPEVERMTTLVAEVAFRCLQPEKEMRPMMDEVLQALQDIQEYRDEENGEVTDNVKRTPPPSLEGENVVPLKNGKDKVLSSPHAVTDAWVCCSTTSTSSGEDGVVPSIEIWFEYVNLPALGNAANKRHDHAIKIWSFYLIGMFCLDPTNIHAQDGYIGIYVILDRESSSSSKPFFSDIFDLRQARVGQMIETDAPSVTILSKIAVMVR
ncbi:Non-specific serine/threonine protein kinase [Bertholletia excelsa]